MAEPEKFNPKSLLSDDMDVTVLLSRQRASPLCVSDSR
jgi:hypothetical protein